MPNQHKPLPPESVIREPLTFYFNLGFNDLQIVQHCRDHYDTERYGLGVTSVKRLRRQWNLQSTRQQQHNFETISQYVANIRQKYPFRGAENIRKMLRQNHGLHVPRDLIGKCLQSVEPEAVHQPRHRRVKQRRFICAGVNDIWAQDQNDKWKRFGLWFHNSIDPFINFNNWMKVWWTNRNPRLIASYYIEAARKLQAVPLTTQSARGTENFGTANCHTVIRHRLDPSLADTLQHCWMGNTKCKANWSLFRRDFTPGFEKLFDQGVNDGLYDVDNPLENLVFRWLAIPWIQAELDGWVALRNRTAPRADRNKILPHGIPELIRTKPEMFNSTNFKIPVPSTLLDEVEQLYAPPDHAVFQLVPPVFGERASILYRGMGQPIVNYDSFWEIYQQLLRSFMENCTEDGEIQDVLASHTEHTTRMSTEDLTILPGLRELQDVAEVIGQHGDVVSLRIVDPEAGYFTDVEGDGS